MWVLGSCLVASHEAGSRRDAPHCSAWPHCRPQGARHVAKDLAGTSTSNPTATLLSTVFLLKHLKLHSFGRRLEDAVLEVGLLVL